MSASMIIPLKCSPKYDLKEPLSRWIDGHAKDEVLDPVAYEKAKPFFASKDIQKDLTRINALRKCLSESILKPQSHKHALDEMALQDCHEYHAVLQLCEDFGLPFSDDISNLELEWKFAVSPTSETHGSLQYDKVCTLWNVAALESFLATTCDTVTKEGRKQAVKHYQNASATMKHCQLAASSETKFDVVDLSDPCLEFWQHTMLALAQMAAYEMASTGAIGTKHSLLSYLAIGAVPELNEALQLAQHPLLRSNLPKPMQEWGAQLKHHSLLMQGRAEYHQAVSEHESKNWGHELKRLQLSQDKLQECVQFSKTSSLDAGTAERLLRLVQDRLVQAANDNRLSYGEEIPTELPPIPPKLLVRMDQEMPESMKTPKVALFQGI